MEFATMSTAVCYCAVFSINIYLVGSAAQADSRRPPPRILRSATGYIATRWRSSSFGQALINRETRSSSVPVGRSGEGVVPYILEFMAATGKDPVNCTRLSFDHFDDVLSKQSFHTFGSQVNDTLRVANTISSFLGRGWANISESDKRAFYMALLQATVEADPLLYGAGMIFFQSPPLVSDLHLYLYVYKTQRGVQVATDTRNLRGDPYQRLFEKYLPKTYRLYHSSSSSRNFTHDGFTTRRQNTVRRSISRLITRTDGMWNPPYFDCHLAKSWLLTFSAPFLQDTNGNFQVSGVVVSDIDLRRVPIDQCARDGKLFSSSHKCRPETTKCVAVPSGKSFRRGSYKCQCNEGFYFPIINSSQKYFNGTDVESEFLKRLRNESDNYDGAFQCLPCQKGCAECIDDRPCFVEYNILLRGIPLGIQSFCMTITMVLGLVVFRLRKTKVMRCSMWVMLELLLVGSLLLYSTVVIRYFEPTTITCLIVPWFREVGFAIIYGVLLLKTYRLLAEFQSRKAHRVHVRDKDLLKYLLLFVVIVFGYMAAWTAVNMDHVNDGITLLTNGKTPEGLNYYICKPHWWDYVIEVVELLFLLFGIYLCYCVWSAPTDYGEGKYITVAISNETLVSLLLYILRHFVWLSLHPDYLFLMYFIRCQLTVSITLILLLGPKLWFIHRPPDEEHMRTRAYSQSDVHDSIAPETMKLNIGISSNGDVDVGEINLADMDPEDIRIELKRLYTQLQLYKTKTMRKDNPHIPRRRGGRKQTHRRFSLQAFHHKHRHHHDHDHDHEMSKTPEESTNSAEAVAIAMETGGKLGEEVHESRPGPSVSFKPAHK